jgi:choice-of-anchor B domain-containing protein
MGLNTGTSFIDISDLEFPRIVGFLPTHTINSSWRDIKTYGNYAFIVSEASGHGMQVFDLTKLRNISPNQAPETFTSDAHYDGFGDAHNIVINKAQGYAYAVGTSTYSGGPHFIDISNPLTPVAAGGYGEDAYSHDAQVVTYNGPDNDYTGKEILIGSNENEVVIVDVTDKMNPTQIAKTDYPNIGYTHQGWFTEDQNYFILGDELDERNFGGNTRNIVFDFTDLDNPSVHLNYYGPTTAIDHNGYVKENDYYLANYSAGIRVIDIANINNETMTEIGYFDTYPSNDNASFNGVWNVYPYFESGNIIISDINTGFYIVRKSE